MVHVTGTPGTLGACNLHRIETEEFVFELSNDEYKRAIDFLGCISQPILKNAHCPPDQEVKVSKNIVGSAFIKVETDNVDAGTKYSMSNEMVGKPQYFENGKGHMFCTLPAYIGTKVIGAESMSKEEFDFRKQNLNYDFGATVATPEFQTGTPGYHVQYANPDGSVYDSWSPKGVFEKSYRKIDDGIIFGDAVLFLKQGRKVARKGWNGKDMWLEFVPSNAWIRLFGNTTDFQNSDFIAMKTADNKYVPWLASQTDILANDWMVIE